MSRRTVAVDLETPTPLLIQKYTKKFEESERYFLADQAIIEMFKLIPHNRTVEQILPKVSVINDLYSTGIYATFDMAKHIQVCNIDPQLARQSTEVVNQIADFSVSGKSIYFYSFATKYCNWHDQDNYPILDSFVEKLITAYRNKDEFTAFEKDELRNYTQYKRILISFRQYYGLEEFGFKKLDKFLWLYGKEKFPN